MILRRAGLLIGLLWACARAYVTLSGGLGANLDLLADSTYYLTADVTLGAYNVTSTTTSAAHRVTIKSSGAKGFQVNSTGTFAASYIDFTSKNDNSLGATISGSSGTPAVGDQTVGYLLATGTSNTSITLDSWTTKYCDVTNQCVIGWGAAATGRTFTLTNGVMQYCTINSASSTQAGFLGGYTTTLYRNGTWTVSNVVIDNTNTCNDATVGYVFAAYSLVNGATWTNCTFYPAGTHNGGIVIIPQDASKTYGFYNCVFKFNVADAANRALVQIYSTSSGSYTYTIEALRCHFENTGTGDGIGIAQTYGTVSATVRNCIFLNNDGGSAVALQKSASGTVAHTYNDYYNNTTNAFEALHASEITTNPALGNLPTGCTLNTATVNRPDGYAVTGYDTLGSDTYDNLSIDEAVYTSTGYRYAGTKRVTIGPLYALSAFPEAINSLNPTSGTAAGGTSVTLSVRGASNTQGAGTLTIGGGGTVTAWTDSTITVTTGAHAAGAVDAVLTTWRGAVVTASSAFTFTAWINGLKYWFYGLFSGLYTR